MPKENSEKSRVKRHQRTKFMHVKGCVTFTTFGSVCWNRNDAACTLRRRAPVNFSMNIKVVSGVRVQGAHNWRHIFLAQMLWSVNAIYQFSPSFLFIKNILDGKVRIASASGLHCKSISDTYLRLAYYTLHEHSAQNTERRVWAEAAKRMARIALHWHVASPSEHTHSHTEFINYSTNYKHFHFRLFTNGSPRVTSVDL